MIVGRSGVPGCCTSIVKSPVKLVVFVLQPATCSWVKCTVNGRWSSFRIAVYKSQIVYSYVIYLSCVSPCEKMNILDRFVRLCMHKQKYFGLSRIIIIKELHKIMLVGYNVNVFEQFVHNTNWKQGCEIRYAYPQCHFEVKFPETLGP